MAEKIRNAELMLEELEEELFENPGEIIREKGKCRICGGVVIEKVWFESHFIPETGPPIIGPGSREQYARVQETSGLYCSNCGIKYEFLPEDHLLKKAKSRA